MKKIIIEFIVLLALPFQVFGQDTARVGVQVRVQKGAVLLRWAANGPVAWRQTNRHGFWIERYTVAREGKLLEQPEKLVLCDTPVKAHPMSEWMEAVERDDHAAVIAQALFGEDFELTGDDAQGIARIVTMSQELEQRFTFSLFAADQSFSAACLAGWGWRDTCVKPGECYLYRIIPALPPGNELKIEMGSAYICMDEYEELPQPVGLAGIWGDENVMLAWDYEMLAKVYNAYYIEKSTDGVNFSRLPGSPLINSQDGKRIFYVDSLTNNASDYHYRVCGVTTFGETGPASKVITGKGKKNLSYVPNITGRTVNDAGVLELEWEFDERGNELISGFRLNRADDAGGPYENVMDDLTPDRRYLLYDELESSNYFTISAVSLTGEVRTSLPVLIQPLDTIPPISPVGFAGEIDSLGLVRLHWNPNREPDILGYLLFRALRKADAAEEAVLLSDIALRDTCYTDSVDIHNLNSKVYYYLIAVDRRYNHSERSGLLELKKPDVIPPFSPVLSGYRVTDNGIELSWITSPSEDVAEHQLLRKEQGIEDNPPVLVRFPGVNSTSFVDSSVVRGVRYVYSIQAIDSSGLISKPTPSLTVFSNRINKNERRIERLDAVVDREHRMVQLTWSNNLKNVQEFEIFRNEEGAVPTLWKTLSLWQSEVTDEALLPDIKYTYILRALFVGGGSSESKSITIEL